MEYKENHKKCSLAFKKEAAMKAVANKQKLKKKNTKMDKTSQLNWI